MDLKSLLKSIKTNESLISTILGVVVIATVIVLVFRYFKNLPKNVNNLGSGTSTTQEGEGGSYTVVAGDSLWKIAEDKYGSGYEWVKIAEENEIANPNSIEVGQKLALPQAETQEAEDAITGGTYTVVQGDCLWNIAVRTYGDGYRWTEIAQENNLVNPDLIHAGNVLSLPR